jgi:predicted DNA-binding protein
MGPASMRAASVFLWRPYPTWEICQMSQWIVDLPDELVARIGEESGKREVSPSDFVREVFEAKSPKTTPEGGMSLYDAFRDMIGSGDSPFEDLSTNPKQMEGFGRSRLFAAINPSHWPSFPLRDLIAFAKTRPNCPHKNPATVPFSWNSLSNMRDSLVMSHLTIELSDELTARLGVASEIRDVDPAQYVREILESALPKEIPIDGMSAFDVLRDMVGCVKTGVSDLSTNPKHMEGFGRSRL